VVKTGLIGLTCVAIAVSFVLPSCASDVSLGRGFPDADAGGAAPAPSDNGFTPLPGTDASAPVDAAAEAPLEPLKECIGTECVWPRATCGDGSIARCNIDLLTDNDNCGECGHKCEDYTLVSLSTKCTDGKCRAFCTTPNAQDCNGLIDDGCETDVMMNPKHCGACGVECPEGVPCNNGVCGCAGGLVSCNGQCVDILTDDDNCGACGNVCPAVSSPCDGGTLPPYTKYKCAKGVCGQFICSSVTRRDCNGDMQLGCGSSDGCETDVYHDPNNCGSCGNECAPGQYCRSLLGAPPQCVCGPGETACGNLLVPDAEIQCVDLSNDPQNCGACGHVCPTSPNANAVCRSGICGLECPPNRADCNGDWADGCEIDLLSDMRSCGACGQACNVDAGQPCINGTCLMVECDAGVIAK